MAVIINNQASTITVGDTSAREDLPPGHIYGCTVTGNDTTQTATVAIGSVRSDADDANIKVTSPLTVTMTTTGANGRDTGAASNGVWYVYVIRKSSDGTIACLASLSSTSPTMPSGYDQKRLVGTLTYISSAIVGSTMHGNGHTRKTRYTVAVQQGAATFTRVNAGTTTYTDAIAWANYVPSTAHRICFLPRHFSQANGSYQGSLTINNGVNWSAIYNIENVGFACAQSDPGECDLTPGGTRAITVAITATAAGTYTMGVYQNLQSFTMEY